LEREQKRGRKVERETGVGNTGSKATSVTASNITKKARDASAKGGGTCFNRRSKKNKYSSS